MRNRWGIVLCVLGLLSSVSYGAKGEKAVKAFPKVAAISPKDLNYPLLTEQQFTSLKKEASERGKRSISSAIELNDDMMSPELRKFRERFLAIHSAGELDGLLNQLDQQYDSFPDDLKLLAANLVPLRAFRSFLYRSIPLVSRAKVTHSLLLSVVQETAQMQQIFLPTDQWKAGFDYVTQPFSADEKEFDSVSGLQNFFADSVYSEIVKSAQRVAALRFSQKPVIWDNQLLYGSASFVDNVDRYRKIGEAERYAMLAAMHGALHNISMFRAYDMEQFFQVAEGLGKLWGVSALLWSPVDGAAAKNRVAKIREYPDCFHLNPGGQPWMSRAFLHLQQSVYYSSLVWNELKDQSASHVQVLDAGMFRPFGREINLSLDSVEGMLKGPLEVRSLVTGKQLTVNLRAFYTNPPASLQSLLPTKFDESPEFLNKQFADNGKSISYRNYLRGRAVAWNLSAFRPYFPSLQNEGDVAEAARILSQSWGGGLLGGPILPALQ